MNPEDRIRSLGVVLPKAPRPLGHYSPAISCGSLLFLSGMLPTQDGVPRHTGVIGKDLDLHEARAAVRCATLNALSAMREHTGGLEKIARILRISVYLVAAPGFSDHAMVADAASGLLAEVFGDAGWHARLVFGIASLPGGMPVELEVIAELHSHRSE